MSESAGRIVDERALPVRLVAAGCLAAGPFAWPTTAVVAISGLWSANLQLSQPEPGAPRLVVARRQQRGLTRRWYLWVAAGAALFAFGCCSLSSSSTRR